MTVTLGIEKCLVEPPEPIAAGLKFGLVMNQASLTSKGEYSCDALARHFPGQLVKLFSPQHGVWGEEQANMIETGHTIYEPLALPLYSLYSETREPTDEMLSGLDALVIDLQDVGTRVYTFIWTMTKCMAACARAKIPLIVLDRPNPLGGLMVEGPCLKSAFRSFVGLADIPMRHSLTIAEVANLVYHELEIKPELLTVGMAGWSRSMLWPDTRLKWTLPSPNMPTYATTCVYPGGVLLEGTNLSEGRGTTIPFEVIGAPFIDGDALARELNARDLPGVRFRPTRFRPTFDKWRGESCRGVFIDVVDEKTFDSYRSVLHLLHIVSQRHRNSFQFLPPPYEYETVKPPIDILSGNDELRLAIEAGCDTKRIDDLATVDQESWHRRAKAYWMYD